MFLTEHGLIRRSAFTVLVEYLLTAEVQPISYRHLISLQIPHNILAFGVTSESSSSDIHAEE